MSTIVNVITTLDDTAAAEALAARLVEERLAACVQVYPVRSIYRWQGKVERSEELRLEAKTTAERAAAARARVRELHPYDEPEILVTEIMDGAPSFLAWVRESVT
jgi:periplasmic divalent cation tolerance protein